MPKRKLFRMYYRRRHGVSSPPPLGRGLPSGTRVCYGVGERCKTSVLAVFHWEWDLDGQCQTAQVCQHCAPSMGWRFDIAPSMPSWLGIDLAWTRKDSCLVMSGWMDVQEVSSWKNTHGVITMVLDKLTRAGERKLMSSRHSRRHPKASVGLDSPR